MAEDDGSPRSVMVKAEALAAKIRSTRDSILEGLRSGSIVVEQVLGSDDPFVTSIKVVVVLENITVLGKVSARRVLEGLAIDEGVRVCNLDDTSRMAILGKLKSD